MQVCDECGNRGVRETVLDDATVGVCELCGHTHGDPAVLARAREREEAEQRGIAPAIYPLVKALEGVEAFRVSASSPGRPARGEYPFVFLRVAPGGLADVERLLTSLEMANRHTARRWVVECSLQRGLLFIIRPRFWKAILDITERDILEARDDLPLLAKTIARDVQLGWWGD